MNEKCQEPLVRNRVGPPTRIIFSTRGDSIPVKSIFLDLLENGKSWRMGVNRVPTVNDCPTIKCMVKKVSVHNADNGQAAKSKPKADFNGD